MTLRTAETFLDGKVTLHRGDCLEVLRSLPDACTQTVVTSPPYWGLRDYGVNGQIGLEPTLGEHMAVLVRIFREVRRVLRPDGTVWINYGDAYASAPNGRSAADTKAAGNDDRTFRDKPISTVGGVLKPKDRMLLPARLAIALQEDGWWLRDEIVWHKPNPMPSSVRDRTTPAHEMIYMLSKRERYYYDQDAIREPLSGASVERGKYGFKKGEHDVHNHYGEGYRHSDGLPVVFNSAGRNKRSVWTVTPEPFAEAHFATFPQALIEPCIIAGSPPQGVVLDIFAGSGTTGLVAARLGRRAVLIELNPAYCDMIGDRFMAGWGGELDAAACRGKRAVIDAGPLFGGEAA